MPCLPQVFYMTAFGFVGYTLFYSVSNSSPKIELGKTMVGPRDFSWLESMAPAEVPTISATTPTH